MIFQKFNLETHEIKTVTALEKAFKPIIFPLFNDFGGKKKKHAKASTFDGSIFDPRSTPF